MPFDPGLLARGLDALGLGGDAALLSKLARYASEIELWNPAYGLVGASGDELVVKHLLDSLAPIAVFRAALAAVAAGRSSAPGFGLPPPRLRIADLGTGAGLPGIPLSLALPAADFALVDRMGKRIRFLESQKAALGLANVAVVEAEVERAPGPYDVVTFRAFRPFERRLFERVFALCEPDGFVIAYKGRLDRARAELAAIEGLYSEARIEPLAVPFLEDERCAAVLRPA